MTEDHVFPEDSGTGASNGDAADAANFGSFGQHDLISDYKAAGLDITVDFAGLTFDVSAGKAFVKDTSADTAQTSETRDQGVVYGVEVAPRTGVGLTDSSVNNVFLDFDLTADDSVSITVTTGTNPRPTPSGLFLRIAEIDTSANTLDEEINYAFDTTGKDIVDGTTVIYDTSEGHIPEKTVEQGPGSGLNADTVDGKEASTLSLDVADDGTIQVQDSTQMNFRKNLNVTDSGSGISRVDVIQGSGSGLNADTVDGIEATDLGSNVSNNGTKVTNSATDIDFLANLVATDDGDGTSTIELAREVSTRLVRTEDLAIHRKTLESTETITISSDEGAVVSNEYTVNGTLNIDDGGSLSVV